MMKRYYNLNFQSFFLVYQSKQYNYQLIGLLTLSSKEIFVTKYSPYTTKTKTKCYLSFNSFLH